MRFGVREIANVVLRAKATQKLGSRTFYKGEPVLYFDTLKTSTLEGAATTVYATGGRGNVRLVAWEGERTLTFTMEDALLSPESFSILSGAGLVDASATQPAYIHTTSRLRVEKANTIVLPEEACWNGASYGKGKDIAERDALYHAEADIFIMVMDGDDMNDEPCIPATVDVKDHKTITCFGHHGMIAPDTIVTVDYYVKRTANVKTITITADKFGGNYYLEADTLFRRESDGVDMPAEFIIPNCKVQSNFTFSMAATGDPSTFTFTMDAFPDYTKFNDNEKVFCDIQVITDVSGEDTASREPCSAIESYDYETGVISYGDKAVKDLYNDDVKLTLAPAGPGNETGVKRMVTGTFKAIDEWDELPHSSWQDQVTEGSAFYAIQIPAEYKGHKLDVYSNGSRKTGTDKMGDQELYWVLNVTQKPTIRFDIDDVPAIELDFSGITIQE